MNDLPPDIAALIEEIDAFIEAEIRPLEQQDDNARFFDHRREYSRSDYENGGIPSRDWEALLEEMMDRADRAGLWRYQLPEVLGGRGGSNLAMAVVREHMARRGIGLHNDPQSEISIIGNFPTVILLHEFGTAQQKDALLDAALSRQAALAFGLTEPNHGSDATYLETTARRWTFNMPTDHAEVSLNDVRVGDDAILGELDKGLAVAQRFVHENRIRQAASSLGSAAFCIDEAVRWARERTVWGRPLWRNQGIQFPLAELWTDCELVRGLVRSTAAELDRKHHMEVTHLVAMANYRANRLACEAADRAMQTCGGLGYTRHMPFEHIYRHHRRYRITEGSEEVQLRKVGYELFQAAR